MNQLRIEPPVITTKLPQPFACPNREPACLSQLPMGHHYGGVRLFLEIL